MTQAPEAAPSARVEFHLSEFVFKTVTDCNLRCTYPCYEYVDDDWQNLPPVMEPETARTVSDRIGKYAADNQHRRVDIIFHGGEPLFMPKPEDYYDTIIPAIANAINEQAPDTNVKFAMQTNGMMLRPSILDVLKQHEVGIGVSVDGYAESHDSRRTTAVKALGSHALTMRGLGYLQQPEYQHMFRGLLCVVNIDADPLKVDDFLQRHDLGRNIDYLLPYGNHDNPPPAPQDPARQTGTPYADWLLPIFRRRYAQGTDERVRLFGSIKQLVTMRPSRSESIGPMAGRDVVIRTDGSYELIDALKMTGASVATGMNATDHSLEQVASRMRRAGYLGIKPIATTCLSCPKVSTCGGGHVATRYSAERRLNNPSVYCEDLYKLITEIGAATLSQVDWSATEGIYDTASFTPRPDPVRRSTLFAAKKLS